jgi:hypothetical protein
MPPALARPCSRSSDSLHRVTHERAGRLIESRRGGRALRPGSARNAAPRSVKEVPDQDCGISGAASPGEGAKGYVIRGASGTAPLRRLGSRWLVSEVVGQGSPLTLSFVAWPGSSIDLPSRKKCLVFSELTARFSTAKNAYKSFDCQTLHGNASPSMHIGPRAPASALSEYARIEPACPRPQVKLAFTIIPAHRV